MSNNCVTTKKATYASECCDCLELKTDNEGNNFLIKGDKMVAIGSTTTNNSGGGLGDVNDIPNGGVIGGV